MVTSIVPRVTHEKFNMFKNKLESIESLSPDSILTLFSEIFEYDPSMKFYSKEKSKSYPCKIVKKSKSKNEYEYESWWQV